MPVTSMANIQAKPSILNVKSRPNSGSHSNLLRITPPVATAGKAVETRARQMRAVTPANQVSALRALDCSSAATQLPTKGSITTAMRSVSFGIAVGQPFQRERSTPGRCLILSMAARIVESKAAAGEKRGCRWVSIAGIA